MFDVYVMYLGHALTPPDFITMRRQCHHSDIDWQHFSFQPQGMTNVQ